MNTADPFGMQDTPRRSRPLGETQPRPVGTPLPVGNNRPMQPPPAAEQHAAQQQPTSPQQNADGFNLQGAFRAAVPLVQKLLPLLDGNIASTVMNLIAPQHPASQPPAPTAVAPVVKQSVDLAPLETSFGELRAQNLTLHNQLIEQTTSIKRVEDQLEMVREATDRNTLEQQELMDDLKSMGSRMNAIAFLGLALLAGSVLLNVLLYMHIQRVLP